MCIYIYKAYIDIDIYIANVAEKSFSFEIFSRILSTVVQQVNKVLSGKLGSLCLAIASLHVAWVLVN